MVLEGAWKVYLTYLGGKEKEKDRCSYVLKTLKKKCLVELHTFICFIFSSSIVGLLWKQLFFVMYVLHRGLLKCFTLIFFLPCYLKYNQLQPVIGFWPVTGVTWTSKCCRTESVWSESSNRTYKLIWKAFTQVIKQTSVQLYAAAFAAPCWTLQVQATSPVLRPSLFSLPALSMFYIQSMMTADS